MTGRKNEPGSILLPHTQKHTLPTAIEVRVPMVIFGVPSTTCHGSESTIVCAGTMEFANRHTSPDKIFAYLKVHSLHREHITKSMYTLT